jgi:hypothetical protein
MLYGSLIDQNFFANHFQGGNAMGRISSGADELGSDFDPHSHLFFLQRNCTANSKLSFPVQAGRSNFTTGEILTGTATELGLLVTREQYTFFLIFLEKGKHD